MPEKKPSKVEPTAPVLPKDPFAVYPKVVKRCELTPQGLLLKRAEPQFEKKK